LRAHAASNPADRRLSRPTTMGKLGKPVNSSHRGPSADTGPYNLAGPSTTASIWKSVPGPGRPGKALVDLYNDYQTGQRVRESQRTVSDDTSTLQAKVEAAISLGRPITLVYSGGSYKPGQPRSVRLQGWRAGTGKSRVRAFDTERGDAARCFDLRAIVSVGL
jgi:hypothetical protein